MDHNTHLRIAELQVFKMRLDAALHMSLNNACMPYRAELQKMRANVVQRIAELKQGLEE